GNAAEGIVEIAHLRPVGAGAGERAFHSALFHQHAAGDNAGKADGDDRAHHHHHDEGISSLAFQRIAHAREKLGAGNYRAPNYAMRVGPQAHASRIKTIARLSFVCCACAFVSIVASYDFAHTGTITGLKDWTTRSKELRS